MPDPVEEVIAQLQQAGANGVDEYAARLRSYGVDSPKVAEFISEGRVALMFLRNGWSVTLQDRPDLLLEFAGEKLYAEVKHFRMKAADRRDEAVMKATEDGGLFVRVGCVVGDEGRQAWEQMYDTAVKKAPQYIDGAANILIFDSHSNSLDLMLQSAVNEFDESIDRQGADPARRRLSGMMMLSPNLCISTGGTNVEFIPTRKPDVPLSLTLAHALREIGRG